MTSKFTSTHNLRSHSSRSYAAFAAAAIVLGAALAPAAAFAQARNVNDGGQVAVSPGAKLDSGSKPATTQPYYGRSADDGGTGPQPTSARVSTATPKPARTLHLQAGTPAPAAPSRSANDGGPTN
jgi:hypothetical protein